MHTDIKGDKTIKWFLLQYVRPQNKWAEKDRDTCHGQKRNIRIVLIGSICTNRGLHTVFNCNLKLHCQHHDYLAFFKIFYFPHIITKSILTVNIFLALLSNTIWYLHSHVVCAKLSVSLWFIRILLVVCCGWQTHFILTQEVLFPV